MVLTNLAATGFQDGSCWRPKWRLGAQLGGFRIDFESISGGFARLMGELCEYHQSPETNDSITVLLYFEGLVRDSRELCYAILVVHWAVLDDFGSRDVIFESFWQF